MNGRGDAVERIRIQRSLEFGHGLLVLLLSEGFDGEKASNHICLLA